MTSTAPLILPYSKWIHWHEYTREMRNRSHNLTHGGWWYLTMQAMEDGGAAGGDGGVDDFQIIPLNG